MKTVILCSVIFATVLCAASASAQGGPPGGPPGGPLGVGGHPMGPPGGPPPPPGPGNSTGTPATRKASPERSVTASNGMKLGPPGRWWDDRTYIQSIGVSKDQQRRMDGIFNANKAAIIATYENLQREQAKLNALTHSAKVDQAQTFAQIDTVNQARAALEKANTQMLLQIRQQLDPSQISKLEKLP